MRKSIIGIIMAVTLVGSSLAFPVQAYAIDDIGQDVSKEDIYPAEEVENNRGIICYNRGTVKNNYGTVKNNFGTVENNNGGIVENNFNWVENNDGGTVVNNFGGDVNGGTVTNQWYEYSITGGSFKSGSTPSKDADYKTWIGKAGSTDNVLGDFYITVAANDGMTFDYATVDSGRVQGITNADGSISFGNISSEIRIFFKQFINNNNNNNAGEEATIESITANEEAMPVTSFISDEAVAKIPEAAKNLGATYNLSVITSSQGLTAAINKISEAVKVQNAVNNADERITSTTIYSEKPMLYTADVLNAISASDIDFVFVFMHNDKMYKVTIPRGARIDFTGHVCEGPLYVGWILGTSEEIG